MIIDRQKFVTKQSLYGMSSFHFWATVCKTVRPMLADRCLSVLPVSMTLVYCGQTFGWINMKLGTEV